MIANIRLAVLAAAVLAVAPQATTALPVAAPASQGPALWRLSDGDSRVYLFGTLHLLPEGVKWQTPVYEAAMADAETTVVECDTDSRYAREATAMLTYERGINASHESLSGIIGARRFDALAAHAERYGLSRAKLARMRPWLAMTSVSFAAMDKAGFRRDRGVERTILSLAATQGDKRTHLETAEGQIKALASMDNGPDMLTNIDHGLAQLANFETSIEPLVTAWRAGDLAALDRLTTADARRRTPSVYRAILVDRNRNWIPAIERWLGKKHDYFVAVGAAHLVGPDSVIAMLQAKGYKVERIQ
jgi:uncharacterized protein YbaP (TraB family)